MRQIEPCEECGLILGWGTDCGSCTHARFPWMPEYGYFTGRWGTYTPAGPAPEGWHPLPLCSRVNPHTEGYPDENDDMNADHYRVA